MGVMGYEKTPEELKADGCKFTGGPVLHLWMGGTHPRFRRFGYMRRLRSAVRRLVMRAGYYKAVTFKTHKNKWHHMYQMCVRQAMTPQQIQDGVTHFTLVLPKPGKLEN